MRKEAIEVEHGGLGSRAVSGTIGQLGSLLNLHPVLSLGSFKNPRLSEEEELAKAMAAVRPQQLSNTKLRLGGPDAVDDLIWKQEAKDEDLPWTQQIGGRMWQNPRTSVLGKLWGTATYPIGWTIANLLRVPHYTPFTDTVAQYWREPAVTSHELGHAIDYNERPVSKSFLGRQGYGLLRDLYTMVGRLPLLNLWQEGQANAKSQAALDDIRKFPKDKMEKLLKRRGEVLPAGFGSHLGTAVGLMASPLGVPPAVGTLAGMLKGKLYGMTTPPEEFAEVLRALAPSKDKKQHETEKKGFAMVTPQKFARWMIEKAAAARGGLTKVAREDRWTKLAQAVNRGDSMVAAIQRIFGLPADQANTAAVKLATAGVKALKAASGACCKKTKMKKVRQKRAFPESIENLTPEQQHQLLGALGTGTVLGGALGLGGLAGGAMGHGRGNTAEGIGRGILRTGATGLGAGLGGVLGAGVGSLLNGQYEGIGGLQPGGIGTYAGGLLGGLAGYAGSGLALGDPVGDGTQRYEG